MNEVWNLGRIYTGFDDPAFAADMDTLRTMVSQYNAFAMLAQTELLWANAKIC